LKKFYIAYALFLAGIVGLSRVYLGVYYPTDVLAGWAIGSAWALLCWVALRTWLARSPAA
jgi:undecaprenyl-diphosphatase